jgi:AcrR family transcriptional regulator
MARKYELRERAENVAATRERIVEATVGLHEQLGPARTTISAIADRANVQRLTVYRHFPDDRSLFQACSAHWTSRHPRPDTAAWELVGDPRERLRTALLEIYAFFRRTEAMTGHVLRDLHESPALREVAEPLVQYWLHVREVLDDGWQARGRQRKLLRAAVGHAIAFETWHSLTGREGLSDTAAAAAMVEFVVAVEK